VSDEQELAVLSLQERIRMHTMGIRNWGYFGAVVRISKELYSAGDAAFSTHHGFTCTDFIEVMHCVVREFERRQGEHWNRFRRVVRGKNPGQVFRFYFKNVPGLIGNAEEMLAALPNIDVDGAKATLLQHYDLRLSDCGTFAPDEIGELSGRSSKIVESVFRAISLRPGVLEEAKTEHLFLANPIWEAPSIDLGSSFFLPMPHAVFSHIHRIMDRLAVIAGFKEAMEKIRSRYLQDIVGRRNGDDLDGPAFLSAVGHRLAHAARDIASDGGRIGEKSAEETQKEAPQTADFVIPCDSWTPIFPLFRTTSMR
jgi:hypothetical protein